MFFARLTLMQFNLDIHADENSKYDFVIAISKGELDFSQITDWLKKNSR